MKDFWKMLLAVICGLLLFGFIAMFIFGSALSASMAASQGKTPVLPREGVLAIDMSTFVLAEQENPIPSFNTGSAPIATVSLYKAVEALKKAASDPGVKYVFLRSDGNLSSAASLEELRKALSDFRKSGKPVVAYIESPSTTSYWLASVADKVYMTEYQGSMITVLGVNVQTLFLKDLLDRFGVNVQLIRHGKFKSAGEMYTRNAPSAENALQYNALVGSMWSTIRADIAASRGISEAALDGAVDGLKLCLPEDFVRENLVDGLLTREGLKARLADLAVAENFGKVAFIPFPDYVTARSLPNYKAKAKIAVLYTDGEIVDGRMPQQVAGDRFTAIIDKVRSDSTVKAVVLRVNSPGGSVLASEKIKHELDLLGAEKPLIASYGGYAASGGYWISNNCDKIFSDALTLTGSIGVFGMVPDFSKTAKDKLKIGVANFSSSKHGDMYSLTRPFDNAEYNYMLRSIETIYDKFTTIVSEGRDMPVAKVDEIGQGRVWTGADALGIGLVDEIGTLSDAIAYAAVVADLPAETVAVKEFPEPLNMMQQIRAMISGKNPEQQFVKELGKPQILARMPFEITVY